MSRNKWKPIDLSLQFSIKSDWSKEAVDAPLSDVNSIRSTLPTKTNATRQASELDNIPENGPFILNFANIPFESSESDLQQFFRAFDVCEIELNGSRRGCGYIAFTNINDLAGAWKLNEKMFLSRPIRLSIPLKEDLARQQTMSSRPKFQSQKKPSMLDDDCDNWRQRKNVIPQNESSSMNTDSQQSNWRSKTSTINETTSDSNWRSIKPVAPTTDTISPPENSAWRSKTPRIHEKQPEAWRTRSAAPKPSIIENSVDWRSKAGPADSATTVTSDEKWRRGSVAPSVGGTTKQSVFGAARPVDTAVKDLENESKKLAVDVLRSEIISKPNPWTSKKPPVPLIASAIHNDKSNVLEWRTKSNAQLQSQIHPVATIKPNDVQSPIEISPKKPQPAPPPLFNAWTERLKLKSNTVVTSDNNIVVIESIERQVVEKKNVDAVVSSPEETCTNHISSSVNGNNSCNNNNIIDTTIKKANEDFLSENPTGTTHPVHDTKIVPRQAVVISVNGPYLDPRSHRIPSHNLASDNSKTPTAIPIKKASHSIITPLSSTKICSNDTHSDKSSIVQTGLSQDIKILNSQSSWAKGPPKGLLEKRGS